LRNRLPRYAVEAASDDGGYFWCTPLGSFLLEDHGSEVFAQAYDSSMTVRRGPMLHFTVANAHPEAVVACAMLALEDSWDELPDEEPNTLRSMGVCGADIRVGVDPGVIATLRRAEAIIYWLRDNAGPMAIIDDDANTAMLQRYLIYLSTLFDVAFSSLLALAVHGVDRGAVMVHRLLVEYAVRAHYALKHPEYCLWALTIGEAQDHLKRLLAMKTSPADTIAGADIALSKMRKQFPQLAEQAAREHWHRKQFKDIFVEVSGPEKHVSLYRYPSQFIHGDPIGMRSMFKMSPAGLEVVLAIADDELNAELVDAGIMVVEFLRAYLAAFPAHLYPDEAAARIAELDREVIVHSLRYTAQRNADYIDYASAFLDMPVDPNEDESQI
jgi:hypothetical protein